MEGYLHNFKEIEKGRGPSPRNSMECEIFHTPSNLVVAYWTSDVESTAPLDFLWRHDLWTPFGCPMSCKIRSIISVACDFTTKSDGIWKGQHTFDKGLAIAQQLQVGRFVVKINGDGAVVPCPFARLSHVSPLW